MAGMDEGSIGDLMADLGDEAGLWPEHVPILEAFIECQTQWRVSVMSNGLTARPFWIGLDYPACRVALELAGTPIDRELWAGLVVMEHAAAAALNEVPA